ncbi:MAG: hypothetical protein M1136_04270 [Chloroflexi bacterium]|nr:hypothetical protein [Chloroflexota bacterium]MCL5074855.1 hypothetical protein [Chloroflexota bacterium]
MRRAERNTPGVIDTIGSGFERINRILWVLLFSLALDVLLWLGPRLSAAPLVNKALAWYAASLPLYLKEGRTPAAIAEEIIKQFNQLQPALEAAAEKFNLLGLLVFNIAAIPSFVPNITIITPPTLEIERTFILFITVLLLSASGLFISCLYLALIGQQVRDGQIDLTLLWSQAWRCWISLVGLIGVLLLGGIVIGVPYLLFIALINLFLPVLSGLLLSVPLTVLGVYLFFTVDAIVISEVGPLRALGNSIRVVSTNLWPALVLVGLTVLITLGMQVVWEAISQHLLGALIALVGSAYIAAGLTAASMFFYQSRAAQV